MFVFSEQLFYYTMGYLLLFEGFLFLHGEPNRVIYVADTPISLGPWSTGGKEKSFCSTHYYYYYYCTGGFRRKSQTDTSKCRV
jgi:hypothetical protein